MSTRAAIARPATDGIHVWEGRYHHSDGYPSGLGKTLWRLYHGHFQQDMKRMQQVLIDDHPAGWSFIVDTDFSLEPGFIDYNSPIGLYLYNEECGLTVNPNYVNRPRCYCHGERQEDEMPLLRCKGGDCDERDCDPAFIEWAYVLHAEGLTIYESNMERHVPVFSVSWGEPEPDWEALG